MIFFFGPIVLVLYGIVWVLVTFTAVFLYLLVPAILYLTAFVSLALAEFGRALWHHRKPSLSRPRTPIPQARWSNRR